MPQFAKHIVWFSEVEKEDIESLGETGIYFGDLIHAGFPIADGFIISSHAYFEFLKQNNLITKIKHLLATIDYNQPESILQVSLHIKDYITHSEFSESFVHELYTAYKKLGRMFHDPSVTIRSSFITDNLSETHHIGQRNTLFDLSGESNIIIKVREVWASLFEAKAIMIRHEKHLNHFRSGIAVVVQKTLKPEKSGKILTTDPLTNDRTKIIIEAIYGEETVPDKTTPDQYEIAKRDLLILHKSMVDQMNMLKKVGKSHKTLKVPTTDVRKQKISDKQIIVLATIGKKLERHYYFPQEIAWAMEKGKIFITHTHPLTIAPSNKLKSENQFDIGHSTFDILLRGSPASPRIASGPVRIVHSLNDNAKVQKGDILVTSQTNAESMSAMKKASAVLTELGGRTSHAAIASRELGIPAIVGIQSATQILKTGQFVTVNGTKGEVYKGSFYQSSSAPSEFMSDDTLTTATKVYVNLAEPELAETVAQQQVDGIGLLRAEFMVANIGMHPKKFIHDGKKDLFIDKLAEQLAVFAKAFYPRPVIYRATDFKTNEYRGLTAGKDYEPLETNPLLGYRGAFRYVHDAEVFRLELEALKKVRNKAGFKNIWLMIPYIRTVKEFAEVKRIISTTDLHRSPTFQLWMMVETPSNVILLDKFIELGIDGVSIGSNDLTMLFLGTDRDNSEVAHAYSELDESVLWAFEKIIKTANKHNITSSICGQGPSLYPSLVEKLVNWGITSISVTPDAIEKTRLTIAHAEKKLIQ